MSTEFPEVPALIPIDRPQQVRDRLREVHGEINVRFLEIAELLREVHTNEYWRLLHFASFENFVEETLDMSYRKAMYLAECFHVLIEQLNLPRHAIAGIGWSKAKELLPVITAENAPHWINYASTHTTDETNLAVRQSQAPAGQAEHLRQHSKMTIGMFDDERVIIEEAIELAKRESGTERTGSALVYICADYAAEARARQSNAVGDADAVSETG